MGAKACQRPALWLSPHDLVACPDIWHKLLRSRAERERCVFRARDFFATAELQIAHCCCQPSKWAEKIALYNPQPCINIGHGCDPLCTWVPEKVNDSS
jgi:hypothetical protein